MTRQQFLVTVKFPRNPDHDPTNKVTGTCPASGDECTDVTGQHHTVLVTAETIEQAEEVAKWNWSHITRIEKV